MNNYMLNKSVDDSHIYLNLSIHNDSKTNDIKAFFQRTFDEIILEDPSQYEMSVIRFSLDGMDIPILNLRNFLQTGSSTNTSLIIRFVYNNINYDLPVVWSPFGPTIDDERKYYLYDYDQLCSLMNTTFQNLTTLVNSAGGSISQSPQISYNPQIQRFTLYAEKAVFSDGIIGGVQIWFQQLLYDLFQSLPFNSFSSGGFIKLKIDRVLNPLSNTTVDNSKTIGIVDNWAMIQNYNTLSQQNTAQTIVIQSDLPIINEYINSVGQSSQLGLTTIQLPIVSDFIIDPENGFEMFRTISYVPTAEYRMIDMVNSSPLNKISLNFFWQDKQGILHPLDISPLRTISVKILFRRKGYHSGKQPEYIENTNTKQLRRY